ncbi:hypothetical protein U1Q18_031216 [Sarracenia purpurea var. burkii]
MELRRPIGNDDVVTVGSPEAALKVNVVWHRGWVLMEVRRRKAPVVYADIKLGVGVDGDEGNGLALTLLSPENNFSAWFLLPLQNN